MVEMISGRRIPVLVVAGFLGAGKTTLVRWLLEQAQATGVRLAVVSNEFGALGIDQALLGGGAANYVEIAGGCVCCQLSDELLRTVQLLYERAHPDRLVVETSGIALPSETLLTFWRNPVRQWVEEDMGVVVVDAKQVADGRDLQGTFEEQVTSADLVVLNKTDLVSENDLARVEERLRQIEPDAPIIRAIHCRVDPELLFPPPATGTRRPRPQVQTGRPHFHDQFSQREIDIPPGVASADVVERLRQLGALRIKGFVSTKEGIRIVQGVGGRVQLSPAEYDVDPDLIGRVVVIERASVRNA
jgi:cobalamin biosynthesis protein CobW